MDDAAFDALPRVYRVGLGLRALGADDALIADCLNLDVHGIVALLEIGTRKLERLRRELPDEEAIDSWKDLGSISYSMPGHFPERTDENSVTPTEGARERNSYGRGCGDAIPEHPGQEGGGRDDQ